MDIIKKSGRIEEYTRDKVKNSIAAASDESAHPLNESDLNRLANEFDQLVQGKETITSQQITVIIAGLLYTNNYTEALKKYLDKKPVFYR